jgi:hypothetical protein
MLAHLLFFVIPAKAAATGKKAAPKKVAKK